MGLVDVARERACPRHGILQHVPDAAWEGLQRNAVGLDVLGAKFDRRGEMIVQVSSDAGQRVDDVDPVFLELFRIADAGQEQDLRRAVRAARKHNLALRLDRPHRAALFDFDAGGAAVLDHDAADQRFCQDGQVFAVAGRPQEGRGGGFAVAVAHRALALAEAFGRGAVEVVAARILHHIRRIEEPLDQRVRLRPREHHIQRSALGVQRPGRIVLVVLRA